jgi:hypothetical protein
MITCREREHMDYSSIVAVRAPKASLDTTKFFDTSQEELQSSPIDQFLINCVSLNKHWSTLKAGEEVAPELSRLFLLGYVSAVEGYMRSLIRRIVQCDDYTRTRCEPFQLSYGAVLHHRPEALPDALVEETNFSTQGDIAKALQKFVGFEALSASTKGLIQDFDRICQLRHCCTHRFGKLGAKNATHLGLQAHSQFLERQIVLTRDSIADIADIIFALIKSLNNDVFGFVMKRSATAPHPFTGHLGIGWTWHKARDRARFKSYYEVFYSSTDAVPSLPPESIYDLFRAEHRNVGRRRA